FGLEPATVNAYDVSRVISRDSARPAIVLPNVLHASCSAPSPPSSPAGCPTASHSTSSTTRDVLWPIHILPPRLREVRPAPPVNSNGDARRSCDEIHPV